MSDRGASACPHGGETAEFRFGLAQAEGVGLSGRLRIHGDDRPVFLRAAEQLDRGKPPVRADGGEFTVGVARLTVWMPVGILAILAVTALHGSVATDPHGAWYAALAVAVTIGVHLACGRRTVLGVGAGTAVYVVLLDTL
ncbi:hypothetical protein SAMN05216489_01072 [Streptomyces sp. 3213]|uniref:hypothetical protein n=1 Tax=Streptomyces sp. 3213.3 TaxID=1855348 RepID=UPI000897ECC6|nr:hypothetical protein [Streptomyces sp. 3213.3]SEC57339.1 hypothetical protein SAMN05216489_01072 [Streptomyces sp. 3213] [Streptomyces sp. 3213.3]